MAFKHGRHTFISLDGVDLSAFTNTSEFSRSADSHDTTTYGKDSHTYEGGLKDGTFNMSGIYSDDVAGPRATIEPLLGTVVPLLRQTEGVGSGLPQDSVDVLVMSYVETNPVADMIAWSAECQLSGDVDATAQTV